VSKATLVNFGYDTKDSETEKSIIKIQSEIYNTLENYLSKYYKGLYEILNKQDTEVKEPKYKNSAIVIDFDEQKMSKKKFAKAIYECTKLAYTNLKPLIKK